MTETIYTNLQKCKKCKYYEKDNNSCVNETIIQQMIDCEPGSLNGFFPLPDFYCKFWEEKEKQKK